MAPPERRYTDEVPEAVEVRLREICLSLPEVREEVAWKGTRWRVRTHTFVHVIGIDEPGRDPSVVMSFRAAGDELEVLRNAGHPFFILGWGRDAVGMVLDDRTDWDEVCELVTESYCVLAPKKLVALVDRPATPEP